MGGGSRNELLCQWTADATGRRVVAGPAEATALGNLLIQARVMDGLPDGTPLRDVVRASTPLRTYEPTSSTALRD
jgi:rhamnulokinase